MLQGVGLVVPIAENRQGGSELRNPFCTDFF